MEKASSWQTKEIGGLAESVVTDTSRRQMIETRTNHKENKCGNKMHSLFIRVGIDSGNIGYVGPVSAKTDHYVFIPIPAWQKASTKRTYGNQMVSPRSSTFTEGALANLMHTDKARVYVVEYDWTRKKDVYETNSAKHLKIHLDPDFEGLTYGDFWGSRFSHDFDSAKSENEDRHMFFYAGLAPFPDCFQTRTQREIRQAQKYHMDVYIIGHIKVKRVYSVQRDKNLEGFEKELGTNAHYIEKEHLKPYDKKLGNDERKYFSKLVIAKGKSKGSRQLLPKAIQLTTWNNRSRKYCPTDIGKIVGIKPNTGIRQILYLDDKKTRQLLDIIDSHY